MKKVLQLMIVCFLAMGLCSCAASKKKTEVEKQVDTDYQMAVNFYESGHTPEAIRSLALVLANDPAHAEANHLMGFIRMGRGEYEKAVKHFKTALETKPDMLTCKNNLGAAYMHMEEYENAAVIFKELSQSPLYTSPWLAFVNLGWAYYKMGMTQEAIDETEMAIALNPELCLGYNNLGIFYSEVAKLELAEKDFKEAIRLCSNYPEPHLHLGMIYADQGSNSQAYTHFKKCAELTPRSDLGKRCQQNADVMR